jgi:hypothetical protein
VRLIVLTSVEVPEDDIDTGRESGSGTATPTELPGTSIQIILAICQPISMTSTRLTNGGKNRLTAAPSTAARFGKLALEIIFNEAISCTRLSYKRSVSMIRVELQHEQADY